MVFRKGISCWTRLRLEPGVDSATAMATALAHRYGGETSAQPVFALLTSDPHGYFQAPVWMIPFQGVCVPVMGGPAMDLETDRPCAGSSVTELVDADTGAWIAFSDGS